MDITYLGHSSFRIRGKDAYVVTDPFDPDMVGIKYPKVEADIVTISHGHSDHNKRDLVSGAKMVVDTPGEYDVSGVSIIGIPTYHDDKKGELRGENTIFVLEIDDLRICHLGDLGHTLSEKKLDEIGGIDVLLLPIGGVYTLDPSQALAVMQSIEPDICIPMHYKTPEMKMETFANMSTLEDFLKLVSVPVETTDKLTIRKDTLGEDQKVVVLTRK